MGDYSKGTRVFVGNLGDSIKKEDLETEFTKYGKLNSVWVAFNPPGFAFIEFVNQDEAEKACDNLNGTEIMGSKLRVEIARGRRGNRRGSGGRRGGSRGRGFSRGGGPGRSSYGDRGGGYRGSRGGGGRGRGRYDDYGSRGQSGYGRERSRDGGRNSYGSSSRDGGGGGYGSGGRGRSGGYNEGSRYRSRSPVARGRY